MKRLIALMLMFLLIISTAPAAFAGAGVNCTVEYLGNSLGQYRVVFTEEVSGTFMVYLYRGTDLMYNEEVNIAGIDETYGLPKRYVQKDTYELMIKYTNPDGVALTEVIELPELGVDTPNAQVISRAEYGQGNIGYVRAVMVPYATVYPNKELTGTPVAQLKHYDLVRVETIENGVAEVKIHVQSGDGTIDNTDNVNGIYEGSENDFEATGFMSASAFEMPLTSYSSDLGREVMELAYTRLGSKGVYSQANRYTDYYLDCAAYAAWCWYQVGIDMSENMQHATGTHGLASWARANNGVLWEAEENKDLPYEEIVSESIEARQHLIDDAELVDKDIWLIEEAKQGRLYTSKKQSRPIYYIEYKDRITNEVVKQMQPGDIIYFNYTEERIIKLSTIDLPIGNFPANEKNPSQGHDHVALFAGYKEDDNGNITAILLESVNSKDNTKVTRLPVENSLFQQIVLVTRPTGVDAQIGSDGLPLR